MSELFPGDASSVSTSSSGIIYVALRRRECFYCVIIPISLAEIVFVDHAEQKLTNILCSKTVSLIYWFLLTHMFDLPNRAW